MQFRLTYQEISNLIERKAGRSLPIIYGGPHTVRIAYEVNMFVKTASVGIDLTVEQIDAKGNIILSYADIVQRDSWGTMIKHFLNDFDFRIVRVKVIAESLTH